MRNKKPLEGIMLKMAQAAEAARPSYPHNATGKEVIGWVNANYIAAGYKNLTKIALQEEGFRPVQSLLEG